MVKSVLRGPTHAELFVTPKEAQRCAPRRPVLFSLAAGFSRAPVVVARKRILAGAFPFLVGTRSRREMWRVLAVLRMVMAGTAF